MSKKFHEGKKHGYIASGIFSNFNDLKKSKIDWYRHSIKKTLKSSDIFWANTKELLHSEYVIADLSTNDSSVYYELGIAWAINYVRDILKRNNKQAVELLEKYRITNKKIIGIVKDKEKITNKCILGGIEDQGQIVRDFDKVDEILKKINKENK